MIELVIKIDCEKTEKALMAVCKITKLTPEEQIKEWLDLNQTLIDIANTAKNRDSVRANFVTVAGNDCLNDLLGILD